MSKSEVWYTRCPVPTALGLAVRRGDLPKALQAKGVAFRSIQATGEKATQQSHFTHSIDRSIRHGGNIPAIYARSQGADTRIVALSWSRTPHPILTLPESGIRGVADLKGKRLALTRRLNDPIDFWRASALRTYEAALASVGLTLADVTLVELPVARTYLEDGRLPGQSSLATGGSLQREEVFALLRGEVDAIYSQSAFATEVQAFTGAEVVFDAWDLPNELDRANNALPEAFTVSARLIAEDFEAVALILAHAIAAADWAKVNPSETLRIVASEQKVSVEAVDVTYGARLAQELDIDLSDFRLKALALRKDFLLRHGFITKDFDLDAWIDPRPLARAQEIAATWRASGTAPLSRKTEVPA